MNAIKLLSKNKMPYKKQTLKKYIKCYIREIKF